MAIRGRWRWRSKGPTELMNMVRIGAAALAFVALGLVPACAQGEGAAPVEEAVSVETLPVTITTAAGRHVFNAEPARTAAEQSRGLMYRTDLGPDDAMLFAPYPPGGGAPAPASFWMKNTPMPLDIIFIRPDGTIARIAENTIPYSTDPVVSGAPVSAILEIVGGRSAELGIAQGDRVTWPEVTR